MTSISLFLSLLVTLFISSVIAVQTSDSKNLKLSETPNKYASPQLYVFGGYDISKGYLSSASQFNSTTGEWERTTGMSLEIARFCGAVGGTKIYLFGGERHSAQISDMAEIYDCETGSYTQFRSMSGPRQDCGAAVLDGYIYVAGGYDGSANLASVIRYNIQTTRRENVSPMHTARAGVQLIELNGRLYAIGGTGTKTVEAYNATTDHWTTMASTQYEHNLFGATVHEGKIYVCSENGFEVYSPNNDEWETLIPPPVMAADRPLVSMNDKLWTLGGRIGNDETKSVFTYNTSTRKWSARADMDVIRGYHTAFVVNH